MTPDQHAALCEALGLPKEATPEEMVEETRRLRQASRYNSDIADQALASMREAEARAQRYREALEPFAKYAKAREALYTDERDSYAPIVLSRSVGPFTSERVAALTVGDFRRAAEALSTRTKGWLSIESAPKDGTHLVLFDPTVKNGQLVGEGYFEPDGDFIPGDNQWYWADSRDGKAHPTYWQPLPAPPEAPSGADAEKEG